MYGVAQGILSPHIFATSTVLSVEYSSTTIISSATPLTEQGIFNIFSSFLAANTTDSFIIDQVLLPLPGNRHQAHLGILQCKRCQTSLCLSPV